jgi:signal transduction histidine kinase
VSAVLGWSVAALATATAALAVARLRCAAAASARAGHEVRGPLCTALLGLERLAAGADAGVLAAVELELRRAALALDELHGRRGRARAGERGRDEIVDVGDLLAAAHPGWSALAAAHGARLALEAPHGLVVHGERLRLAQACGNLVANAVEHGGGDVAVRARALGRTVRVEVTDAGPGLPALVPALLARGRRFGAHPPRRGHGLAVAARVAARHGGRLAAGPSPRGARMVLELPAASAAAVRAGQ